MNHEIEITIDNRIPTSDEAERLLEFLGEQGIAIKKPKLKHFTIDYVQRIAREKGY